MERDSDLRSLLLLLYCLYWETNELFFFSLPSFLVEIKAAVKGRETSSEEVCAREIGSRLC